MINNDRNQYFSISNNLRVDFIKRYAAKSSAELVQIIETAEDYQPTAIEAAKAILNARNLDQAEILKLARSVQKVKIERYLDAFSVVNDRLQLPESHFLNEEEMKLLFGICFTRWKEENDDMIPDSWLYAMHLMF